MLHFGLSNLSWRHVGRWGSAHQAHTHQARVHHDQAPVYWVYLPATLPSSYRQASTSKGLGVE